MVTSTIDEQEARKRSLSLTADVMQKLKIAAQIRLLSSVILTKVRTQSQAGRRS